jgi:hypothetical protein
MRLARRFVGCSHKTRQRSEPTRHARPVRQQSRPGIRLRTPLPHHHVILGEEDRRPCQIEEAALVFEQRPRGFGPRVDLHQAEKFVFVEPQFGYAIEGLGRAAGSRRCLRDRMVDGMCLHVTVNAERGGVRAHHLRVVFTPIALEVVALPVKKGSQRRILRK